MMHMASRLYLNADVGERPQALADGSEEELVRLLDWASIACGGHAGDAASMAAVVEWCVRHRVQVGAHPGYPDRANFGRLPMDLPPAAISQFVFEQLAALDAAARAGGVDVRHVKPHGALYNTAAKDPGVARAIAEGVKRWNRRAILVGLAGSRMLEVWREEGFPVAAEVFADRRYEPDGTLRARSHADALITHPDEAARQVEAQLHGHVLAWNGAEIAVRADTVCVHSDTPRAPAIARAVRALLQRAAS